MTAPPPVAMTAPGTSTALRTSAASISRKRASPSRPMMVAGEPPATAPMRWSRSTNGRPSISATILPMLLLPLPDRPTSVMVSDIDAIPDAVTERRPHRIDGRRYTQP